MLGVGFPQPHAERSVVLELLRLGQIELEVTALAFFLQQHQLVVRVRDRSRQLSARVSQIGLRAGDLTLRVLNRLVLRVELRLHLRQTRRLGGMMGSTNLAYLRMRRRCGLGLSSGCGLRLHGVRRQGIHLRGQIIYLAARRSQRCGVLLILSSQVLGHPVFVKGIATRACRRQPEREPSTLRLDRKWSRASHRETGAARLRSSP